MFNEYPYVNLQDVNLDWILKHIKELETNLQDFIKLNTIKYANPIDWNISKQYEANTVVVNEFTGVAYLSTKPVPSGVDVTNTDYWTPIFTLDFVNLNKNITLRNDGNNNNATFESSVGDWLIVGGQLYKVIQDIALHTAYVVGYNIEVYSVEQFIHDYLNQVRNLIGDLNDLTTTDKTNIVNAINEALNNIGSLTDLHTTDKSSTVNAINEVLNNIITHLFFKTPQDYGAIGDGVTDDTNALIQLFGNESNIFIPKGTYLINNRITIYSDQLIIGQAGSVIKCNYETGAALRVNGDNVKIVNVTVEGIKTAPVGSEYNHAIYLSNPHNVSIIGCTFKNLSGDGVYMGTASDNTNRPSNVIIRSCLMDNCGRNGISVIECNGFIIDDCIIKNTYGNSPMHAIDIEPNDDNFVIKGSITNILSSDNEYGFLSVYLSKTAAFFGVDIAHCISDHDASHDTYYDISVRNDITGNTGFLNLQDITVEQTYADAFYIAGFTSYMKLTADLTVQRYYGRNAITYWGQSYMTDCGYCDITLRLNRASGNYTNALVMNSNAGVPIKNFKLDYKSIIPFTYTKDTWQDVYVKMPYNDIDVWAYVASDGTLNWSNNDDITITKSATGTYLVTGLTDIKAVVTNPRRAGNVISCDVDMSDTRIVVSTFDLAGNYNDCAFYLNAKCSNTTFRKVYDDNYYKVP